MVSNPKQEIGHYFTYMLLISRSNTFELYLMYYSYKNKELFELTLLQSVLQVKKCLASESSLRMRCLNLFVVFSQNAS